MIVKKSVPRWASPSNESVERDDIELFCNVIQQRNKVGEKAEECQKRKTNWRERKNNQKEEMSILFHRFE